jgi:hypothetical protein
MAERRKEGKETVQIRYIYIIYTPSLSDSKYINKYINRM